jgi:hypothetical protein
MAQDVPDENQPEKDLRPAIKAIRSNADRLAEEARDLGEYGRTQTAFFLRACSRSSQKQSKKCQMYKLQAAVEPSFAVFP